MNIIVPELVLVGYVRRKSTNLESGISTHFLVCHYANISMCGFVNSYIKDSHSLSTYKDTYIEETVFNHADIESFAINGESIIIKINEEIAMKYFFQVKNALCRKMDLEIHS